MAVAVVTPDSGQTLFIRVRACPEHPPRRRRAGHWAYRLGSGFVESEQFSDRDIEGQGDTVYILERWVAGAPLYAAEIGDVDGRSVGEFLLRKAQLPTQGADMGTKRNSDSIHGNLA
jgi:hypothetical protein